MRANLISAKKQTFVPIVIYLRNNSKCLTRARRFLSGICIFPRISGSLTGIKALPSAQVEIAVTKGDSQIHRDTNQKAARGAELRTGRRVEEAGLLEGSSQALASNSVPKKCRNFTLISYSF